MNLPYSRFAKMGHFNAVPLGSIRELPAESCKEIKASEGGKVVSGNNYWMDSTRSGNSILAGCDMKTEGLYKTYMHTPILPYCIAPPWGLFRHTWMSKHQCQNDVKCVSHEMNYTYVCYSSGWTGKYCKKGLPFVERKHESIVINSFSQKEWFYPRLFFKWFISLVLSYNNFRGAYEAFKTLHPMRFLQLSYNRNDKN